MRPPRLAAIAIVLLIALLLATSKRFYHLTVPAALPYTLQIAVRKLESIIAFTAVGGCAYALLPGPRGALLRGALLVGGLSTIIEVVQYLHGSHESAAEHLFDICCGAAGGMLGVALLRGLERLRRAPF